MGTASATCLLLNDITTFAVRLSLWPYSDPANMCSRLPWLCPMPSTGASLGATLDQSDASSAASADWNLVRTRDAQSKCCAQRRPSVCRAFVSKAQSLSIHE